jgi:CRISPR-associated protein Csh2
LIGFYGIINENAAKHTNLTEDDVALLIEGMWEGTKNLISRSKAGQTPRLLMKIEYKVNGYHIGDLLTSLKLRLKCDDEFSIRSTEDYAIDITDLKSILMQNKDKIKRIGIRYDSRLKFVEAQREDTIESIFSGFPIAII